MKKTVSILLIVAMMLASMLAIIPASADLDEDIAKYEAYDESKYVSATWAVLVETIAAVKVIKGDVNSTEADIEAASATLSAAVNALVLKADPTSLGAKANQTIKDYPKDPYTAKSYNELRTLVNNINEVVKTNDISQAGIDELNAALDEAVSNLVKKGNFDAIDALLEPFGEIVIEGARPKVDRDIVETLKDKYTIDSLAAFIEVLDLVVVAKKQDVKPNFTEAEATELEVALKAAIDGLVLLNHEEILISPSTGISYEVIDKLVEEINALDESKYTKESWQALQKALKEIEKLKKDNDITREDVDKACEKFNDAYKALVKSTRVTEEDHNDSNETVGKTEEEFNDVVQDFVNSAEIVDLGCQSALGATVVVMCATFALGATVVLRKKED